jgi:hypothetical protein
MTQVPFEKSEIGRLYAKATPAMTILSFDRRLNRVTGQCDTGYHYPNLKRDKAPTASGSSGPRNDGKVIVTQQNPFILKFNVCRTGTTGTLDLHGSLLVDSGACGSFCSAAFGVRLRDRGYPR